MSEIILVKEPISFNHIENVAKERFGDLVKAVVDIEKKIMPIGGEMHADEEKVLLENGSKQENLWGINIYPELPRNNWIEFDSMINIRSRQNNRSRSVEDLNIQQKIIEIVDLLIAS